MSARAVSPVVGVVLLVAVTAVLGGTVAALALSTDVADPAPRAVFEASVDATTDRVAVTHRAGDPVAPDRLRLRILVDGTPVAHQPPVPFFAATGFVSGPTGAFNSASDDDWSVGERATLRLASTNTAIAPGDRVTLRLFVGDRPLAELTVRAR